MGRAGLAVAFLGLPHGGLVWLSILVGPNGASIFVEFLLGVFACLLRDLFFQFMLAAAGVVAAAAAGVAAAAGAAAGVAAAAAAAAGGAAAAAGVAAAAATGVALTLIILGGKGSREAK